MSRTPGRRGSFTKLTAGLVATAALTVASLVATTLPAAAFKPYTHNATAQNAYDDVVAGTVRYRYVIDTSTIAPG